MGKPLRDWPHDALLHLHKTLAYALFFLGAFVGFITMMSRVSELRGETPDSVLIATLTGAILVIALACTFFIFRISRELRRRLM
jgi:hypothetical protein